MRNSILCLASFLLAACSRDAGSTVPAPPVTTLAEVAEIMSELPYEREHLLEVYDAVGSSSGNGYDEEYMMADLFESPGAGVGDERAGTRAASYSRPIRELFAERLASRLATRSGASGVEEYIGALSASDIQIYWPYSEDWDGETLPIITYDPGYGAETNMGYVLEYGLDGLNEERLKEMLTFANAAASIITTRKGALRVMPEPDEVKRFIESRK